MVVPVESLVDAVWDAPPASVRQQIHNVIGEIRRLFVGTPIRLVTSDVGCRLMVPAEMIDVNRFEAASRQAERAEGEERYEDAVRLLRDALALWRGPALAGLAGRYLTNVAVRLTEQRLLAVERLYALRLRLGESTTLVADLTQLVAEYPLRESLRANLMIALYRAGRQGDALTVFDDGRRVLADEMGLDPGQRLRVLQEQILADEVSTADRESETPVAPAPAARRGCFLPRDIAEFTGRLTELDQLLRIARAADTTALVLSSIDGMGGVGKTTLAVHLAHALAEEYPDGQFFVDLHGYSVGLDPLSPAQALDLLLREAGTPPERVPADLAARMALWRSTMAHKRALVVIDNAVDATQVRPLLPGTARILVLVTSRHRLTSLEGAVPLPIDVLTLADAEALFVQTVGSDRAAAEPQAVTDAVELCGRLPLAIRIAAARLRERANWTVRHLVEQLRGQRSRARMLSAGDVNVLDVLALSHRYLTPPQGRLFELLSLVPGPDFDAFAAAALIGQSPEDAEDHLEELFDANLLLQHAAGRYRFHDLVRDCAGELLRQHCDEAAAQQARHRLLDYYLYAASEWCRPFAKGIFRIEPVVRHVPAQVPQAGVWQSTDADFPNLIAAIHSAHKQGRPQYAWQLACVLQPYLSALNYGRGAEELFQVALIAAQEAHDRTGESTALTALALVGREKGRLDEAMKLLTTARAISRELGDRAEEPYQLLEIGVLHMVLGDFAGAEDSYLEAREIGCTIDDPALLAAATNNLGVVCRDTGRFGEALTYFREAQAHGAHVTASSRQSNALTLSNIGVTLHLSGDHEGALAAFSEALASSVAMGGRYGAANASIGLSNVFRALGDPVAALEHGRAALIAARETEIRETECLALLAVGDATLATGDVDNAAQVFQQTRELADGYRLNYYAAMAWEGMAHVMSAREDDSAAKVLWEETLASYPPGAIDAENVKRHLAAIATAGRETVTCPRCPAPSHFRPRNE